MEVIKSRSKLSPCGPTARPMARVVAKSKIQIKNCFIIGAKLPLFIA
jgi:hypothetical protein